MGRVLHRPTVLAVPAFALQVPLRDFAADLLGGQRVVRRLLDAGFSFDEPNLGTQRWRGSSQRAEDSVQSRLGRNNGLAQDGAQLRGLDLAGVAEVDLVVPAGHLQAGARDELVVHPLERLGLVVVRAEVERLYAPPLRQGLQPHVVQAAGAVAAATGDGVVEQSSP